ncbi:MAG: DUF2169 domain-containing protein [Paraglaciecola sp.]|nr:DUF2169 domain-containing protein [Paraglaciecola sp.]
MKVYNHSQLSFTPIVWKINPPQYSLTLIVKGEFKLSANNDAVLTEEPCLITGSVYLDDDPEKSCYYDSDFAYFKPRADLLLVGTCYSPTKQPINTCQVRFQVAEQSKLLNVFGERYRYGLMDNISTPEPFTKMSLCYENSFGGKGYSKNPLGKGYTKSENETESEKAWVLANIEDPDTSLSGVINPPEPAGFAPLDKMWQQRYAKIGSYNNDWLKSRWPWFPEDFNWQHFNAAPQDMQVAGYLKGDESLYFENLHAEHAQYQSRLPGIRVRCFINKKCPPDDNNNYKFHEVKMNLDTLWVDMDTEKLALVWRGFTTVLSDEYEEVEHLLIVSEKLTAPPNTLEYYQQWLSRELANDEVDKNTEEVSYQSEPSEFDQEIELEISKAEEQMRASIIAAGLDPDNLPPPSEEDKLKEAQLLKEMGIEPEKPLLTRQQVEQRFNNGESFEGEDFRGIDLSNMNLKAVDFQAAILSDVSFNNSDLSHANLSQATMEKADFSGALLHNCNLIAADCSYANFTDVNLSKAQLTDAIFEHAVLINAILDHVEAKNTHFSEANLTGVSLKLANLQSADFSNCLLHQADFRQANLTEASVEGAQGHQVNMSQADLTELRASEGCDFFQGNFHQSIGIESIWENAKLAGADFSHAVMIGADFTKATLDKANMYASDMKNCRFNKASLINANAQKMNLFQSSFEQANLYRADFRGANCYQTEFFGANTQETNFLLANLKMTKLAHTEAT